MFQSVYIKDVFYIPVLFILVHVHWSSLSVACERHINLKRNSQKYLILISLNYFFLI